MVGVNADKVQMAVRSLIVAERLNVGLEVSTLVAYPGGDLINVIVDDTGGEVVVHDGGLAAMRLNQQGVVIGRHVAARLADYAKRFNCTFEGSRVSARADSEGIEYAIAMVANASRAVADYAMEIRKHVEADFRSLVADALREIVGKRLRENEEFTGKSGRKYRVSVVILDEDGKIHRFVAPIASRNSVPNGFAMLFDLHGKHESVVNSSVYDEAGDLRSEDKSLLESVGGVYGLLEAQSRFRETIGSPVGHS
jgi:hypothetical protein